MKIKLNSEKQKFNYLDAPSNASVDISNIVLIKPKYSDRKFNPPKRGK